MGRNESEEGNRGPEADRWYKIRLGPSFNHPHPPPPTKVFTLRYEFKPASIDKTQPGSLHKGKNNKVTVEYQNNQYGKPKVTFEGVSEDYKENDAVLFFDGESLRLERLHRAVKRLRHVRLPGESAASAVSAPPIETFSPPVNKVTSQQFMNEIVTHQTQVHVDQVAVIDSDSVGAGPSNPPAVSSELKDYEPEENIDVVNDNDDDFQTGSRENDTSGKGSRAGLDIDINMPHQEDTDDEIADVDISDDEIDKGPNAAEALKAQVNAQIGRKEQTSSSSTSTSTGSDSSASGNGSGSRSNSGSGSSSSDSESSENNSDISI
ncbi:RNA polymerase II transcription elongation factor [Euphorbia peplus]|nr:RNA polymerase II transcription elongation factor [Euphorbia peplus]